MLIDGLQYCNWSPKIFNQWREGGVDCVHVTIAYHEMFRETVANMEQWNRWFEHYHDMITLAYTAADVEAAKAAGKTAVIFGFQNPSPIEDDIGLVEVLHRLGARFMQLTYNNQSLLATGCYEDDDTGLTRMGREVVEEMNRVGMVVDMSHSAERSTLRRLNIHRTDCRQPCKSIFWHPARRNKSDDILKALAETGGMLGFSLYPHHLNQGSDCGLDDFCRMIADTADKMGIDHIGFRSDLCQDQPDSVGNGCGSGAGPKRLIMVKGLPATQAFDMPTWFQDNRHWQNILMALPKQSFHPMILPRLRG